MYKMWYLQQLQTALPSLVSHCLEEKKDKQANINHIWCRNNPKACTLRVMSWGECQCCSCVYKLQARRLTPALQEHYNKRLERPVVMSLYDLQNTRLCRQAHHHRHTQISQHWVFFLSTMLHLYMCLFILNICFTFNDVTNHFLVQA